MEEKQYERVNDLPYEDFVRKRIIELRMNMNPKVSEHKMSIELGRGRSYIRNITSEGALPSLSGLFDIIDYLGVTVDEFFAPLRDTDSPYARLCERLRSLDDEALAKVDTFVDWIER